MFCKKGIGADRKVQFSRACRTMDATGYSDMKAMKERMNTTAKIGKAHRKENLREGLELRGAVDSGCFLHACRNGVKVPLSIQM